jgi:uncharacterized protein YutE (UPF0331/DUF86 family)
MSYIEESLKSLARFKNVPYGVFSSNPDNYRIAFFDLHRALEAAMDIGSHILSRIPGARPGYYKDIPKLLGKHGIIPTDFAESKLTKMAGSRNRMVHFYGEITKEELYNIIQEDLDDIRKFLDHISTLLRNPSIYGLTT